MSPLGELNRLRAEARHLPPASCVGEWTVTPGGVRFAVVAGSDEHGRPALAWQATDSKLYFNPVPTP